MKNSIDLKLFNYSDIEFKPQWQYTNPETGSTFTGGVIPGKLLYTKLRGKLTEEDLRATISIRENLHEDGLLKNCNIIRVSDYSDMDSISISSRKIYAKSQMTLLTKFNCNLTITYIVGASGATKVMLSVYQRLTKQNYEFSSTITEAFNSININMNNSTNNTSTNEFSFDKMEFKKKWNYTNPETGASFSSGVVPGKLFYSKLSGALCDKDLKYVKASIDNIYTYSSFQNNSVVRISDYSDIGKISISTRKAYAQILKQLGEKYIFSFSVTYIIGASKTMRATISLFAKFVNQNMVFLKTVDEAFTAINTNNLLGNSSTELSRSPNALNLNQIQFKPEWEFRNKKTQSLYRSGVISGQIMYSQLSGYLSEKDIRQAIETLESVYKNGHFEGTSFIRIADYSGINKISVVARKIYTAALNSLNSKYDCSPSATYVIGASPFMKTTISLVGRFLKQNMIFFNTLDEVFDNINSTHAQMNNPSLLSTVNVRKSDIDEINALAGSLLFIGGDENELISISPDNPLAELASALTLAKEDLKQMHAHEKEANENLVSSTARFRDIANSMADWIWEVDSIGRYTYCSEKVENILGFTPEEMLGKTPFDFMDPETVQERENTVQALTLKKQPLHSIENWNITKQGEKVCLLTSGQPILDSNGEMIGYRGVNDDITKRKITEQQLKQSNQVQREIMESVDAGIVLINPETHVIERVNSTAEEMFGASAKDIVGKICHKFLCPAEFGCCPITDCDKIIQRSEKVMLHVDGTSVPILKTVKCLEIDGEQKLLETFVDIRDLKHAEQKLRSQTNLQQILMDISTRYINLPLEEIEESINESLQEIGKFVKADRSYIFDYDFINNTTTNTYEFCAEEIIPQLDELQNLPLSFFPDWVNAHTQGQPMIIENVTDLDDESTLKQILLPQGIKSLLTIPMISNGECIGFVGFDWVSDFHTFTQAEQTLLDLFSQLLVNIKHRVTAETNLSIEKDNAQAASRAKSEFLANMSHEIRTPLNGVLGMNTLLMDTNLTSEQKSYVQTVRSSGEALLGIINDILDFSKIEAGKLELEDIPFNLRYTLEDFAEIMAIKAEQKNLEFICAAAPGVPAFMEGDPGRLRQILVNLAGNAIKFTKSGEVSVTATVQSQSEKNIKLHFSIKDTGIGISQAKQSLLFDSFTQADASTTREYGGTGLGLAISKQLVELMHGEIGINSKINEGSEFWFTTTLKKSDKTNETQIPKNALNGYHVLIVDDNATNRDILSIQFKAWGIQAEVASDGPAALELLYASAINNHPFQLAVLDMQMPGMDGETLAGIIKSDHRLKNFPLVMMTSLGKQSNSKNAKESYFAAYLTKPVRQSELFEILANILSVKQNLTSKIRKPNKYSLANMRLENFMILLVEDNITNQMVATGILKKTGVRVDAVANGKEAITALEQIPYDLVFMDIQMPVMDGLEATKLIRAHDSSVLNKEVPIVAMTAHAMQGDKDICINAGMNDYVSKPITPVAVSEVLSKWLECKDEVPSPLTNQPVTIKQPEQVEEIFNRAEFLDRMMDDEDLAGLIVDEFRKNSPDIIKQLDIHINSGLTTEAGHSAHTLKGSASNLSATHLVEIAFKMEQAGKNGNINLLKKLLPELVLCYEKLDSTLVSNGF